MAVILNRSIVIVQRLLLLLITSLPSFATGECTL